VSKVHRSTYSVRLRMRTSVLQDDRELLCSQSQQVPARVGGKRMFYRVFLSVSFLALVSSQSVLGQEIVKKEPPKGALVKGAYVYLDDGSCPKGQLMKVTGGAFAGGGRNARGLAAPRTRQCVPHP